MAKDLVLFTIEFPFGTSESFLENEIIYLSQEFNKVYIVPTIKREIKRETPLNVQVINEVHEVYDGLFIFKNFIKYLIPFTKIYFISFILSPVKKPYLFSFKSIAHHFLKEFQKEDVILQIINKYRLQNAIFYDYWFTNSLLAIISLKKKGVIKKIIARSHRYDLYNEIQPEKIIPFREFKIKELDKLFVISKHGFNYINSILNKDRDKSKISLSYLGVPKRSINIKTPDKYFTIVSCARLLAFKGIDKIALALIGIEYTIRWIHFGDGPEKEKILSIASKFPKNISFELKGQVSNSSIVSFYKQTYVDVFISMSSSEGLPVSIMEAQSFGIPVIAPNINGIPEIVNFETGILLKKPETILLRNELLILIKKQYKFNRKNISKFFESKFDAEVNYKNLIKDINSI